MLIRFSSHEVVPKGAQCLHVHWTFPEYNAPVIAEHLKYVAGQSLLYHTMAFSYLSVSGKIGLNCYDAMVVETWSIAQGTTPGCVGLNNL